LGKGDVRVQLGRVVKHWHEKSVPFAPETPCPEVKRGHGNSWGSLGGEGGEMGRLGWADVKNGKATRASIEEKKATTTKEKRSVITKRLGAKGGKMVWWGFGTKWKGGI